MALQTYIPSVVTVDHDELEGSPEEEYTPDGVFMATRALKCAWADREKLMTELLGGAVSFGGRVFGDAFDAQLDGRLAGGC